MQNQNLLLFGLLAIAMVYFFLTGAGGFAAPLLEDVPMVGGGCGVNTGEAVGQNKVEGEEGFTSYSSWWYWPNYYYRSYWPYYRRSYKYPSYYNYGPGRSYRRRFNNFPYRRYYNNYYY